MNELSWREARVDGICGDVTPQVIELFWRPHQVVKPVLLPESSSTAQGTVDLARRVMLPRFALSQHGVRVWKGRQEVNVVWHDDEVAQVVANRVEMAEAVGHYSANRRPT